MFFFQNQAVSGILGAIGVACGAFGAHGLKNHTSDPALLESWKTAASYQMLHVTLQKPRWDWGGWRIACMLQVMVGKWQLKGEICKWQRKLRGGEVALPSEQ